MKPSFTVNFDVQCIFKSAECEVSQVLINQQCIGYIAENINLESPSAQPVVTTFTEAGELAELHCVGCAAEHLFATHTGLPASVIGITTDGQSRTPLAALLMADVLSAALNRR
ncbi:MAG TPA: hypothetical protein VGN40_15970 [Lelliottia sp.]|jgi:hypothetical protein